MAVYELLAGSMEEDAEHYIEALHDEYEFVGTNQEQRWIRRGQSDDEIDDGKF